MREEECRGSSKSKARKSPGCVFKEGEPPGCGWVDWLFPDGTGMYPNFQKLYLLVEHHMMFERDIDYEV